MLHPRGIPCFLQYDARRLSEVRFNRSTVGLPKLACERKKKKVAALTSIAVDVYMHSLPCQKAETPANAKVEKAHPAIDLLPVQGWPVERLFLPSSLPWVGRDNHSPPTKAEETVSTYL